MTIETTDIVKRFGSFVALAGVSLRVRHGELVAMLGPSGSGKTTLLRIIAGLDWPDEGMVRFDGQDALHRRAGERGVGFVFQHYALFRHLTVHENVAFGLRVRPRRERPSDAQITERVNRLLDMVQLGWLADRYPHQLSGGQRQRIALARALAIEPRVLLLDEPFGALDAKVRKELRRWLRELHGEINVTSLFVTHDQEEALEVADRVVILNHGSIEQIGTPAEVYERPNSAFVHDFIGESFVVPVQVEGGLVKFNGTTLAIDAQDVHAGGARLFVRPHDVSLVSAGEGALTARVSHVRGFGPYQRIEAALAHGREEIPIEIQAHRDERIRPGQTIGIKPHRYRLFPLP